MNWRENLKQDLEASITECNRSVVLGVGNEFYVYDVWGLKVVEEIGRLATRHNVLKDRINIIVAGTVPENFTGAIRKKRPSHIIIVDAAEMGLEVGHARIIGIDEIDDMTVSSHNMKLSILAGYLESEIGCRAILIGVQQGTAAEASIIVEEIATTIYETIISALE